MFATELRRALLDGEVDLAVHSLKDLPTGACDGLVIGAVPQRADARDVLVARDGLTLGELPPGARVGTGSPRRAAQLRALDLGLIVEPIRGNVDTRLRAVADGRYDAVVLARAGLLRLGRADEATEVIDPIQMLPAPGQGALAVECRADDAELRAWLAADRRPGQHTRRSGPSGPCWPRSRPAAARRSGRWPRSPRARTGPSCRCEPSSPPSTAATRCAGRWSGRSRRRRSWAPGWPPYCWRTAPRAWLRPQMSHLSVAPGTEPLIRGTVHPNPSSTTTERVS